MEILYVLPFLIPAFIVFFTGIQGIKRVKYRTDVKKMIRENCTPRRCTIKDFLIYSKGENNYTIFPIVEDKLYNKFYITYGEFNFSYYSTSSISYPGYYDYDVILGGEKLMIGDEVNIYVAKEIEILKLENGYININNRSCNYIGTKNELPKASVTAMKFNQLVNEGDKNFFEEVEELICYEGFIERPNYD